MKKQARVASLHNSRSHHDREVSLDPQDVAVLYAITAPNHVAVNEVLIVEPRRAHPA
jgi:NADP-dependent 3-hydroxy acid dehydrogenase YdfG